MKRPLPAKRNGPARALIKREHRPRVIPDKRREPPRIGNLDDWTPGEFEIIPLTDPE